MKRDDHNPDKKQKIFGYNAVLSTSVEVHLGIELPVAITDIADAKYDIINNYTYVRGNGSIPIIDYNPGNEKCSRNILLERGYDEKGWPFKH